MDIDTLTNHIRNLSKPLFDSVCRIVLRDVFNVNAINVDGTNDGGTDFITCSSDGHRTCDGYQVTVQKSKLPEKTKADLRKSITKLGITKFYFFTSQSISETEARIQEHELNRDFGIPVIFYGARHLSGFLLEKKILNRFLDETGYPLPRTRSNATDYREMALYSYATISSDATGMRNGIYDDALLFVLSDHDELTEEDAVDRARALLGLDPARRDTLVRRIGALIANQRIKRSVNGLKLADLARDDVVARKRIYERELGDLSSAQTDIMRRDFGVDWSVDASKEISVLIADHYVTNQLRLLGEIKASQALHPLLGRSTNIDELRKAILARTNLTRTRALDAASALIKNASDHPLITKLARASVYVALDGSDPASSARAFGAARWSDFDVLIETSVAIPWICSQLYEGNVNRFFDTAIESISRAKKLDINLHIPYFYISECASHLIKARSYINIPEGNFTDELRFSSNAYIANYYSQKLNNRKIPDSLLSYLKTFSPSIQLERSDWRSWQRAVMTDIQSVLDRSGVNYIEFPFYNPGDCADIEQEYAYAIEKMRKKKPKMLLDHDVWTLQFAHDKAKSGSEFWAILTFDRAMLEISKAEAYKAWAVAPDAFVDLTATTQSLSSAKYVSLVHSLANSSERTLSIGARIIDRLVTYSAKEMQNWELKEVVEKIRGEVLLSIDLDSLISLDQVDSEVDEALRKLGYAPDDNDKDPDRQDVIEN